MPDGAPLQPTARSQRIRAVDVLRGFALLGVVVVNTQAFAGEPPPATGLDRVAAWVVAWLFTAKSYTLFSLLFGLGFAIQMERAAARGQPIVPFFLRRCAILLLFGAAHAVLLFSGDILTMYAVLGMLLLRFRTAPPRTLLAWVAGLIVAAVVLNLTGAALTAASGAAGQGGGAGSTAAGPRDAALSTVYLSGSYLDMVRARLAPALTQAVAQLVLAFPDVFAMFLLGLYLGKRCVFSNLQEEAPLFRGLLRWGLLLGLPLNALSATLTLLDLQGGAPGEGAVFWLASAVQSVGAPLLMLGYLGGIVLLVRQRGAAPGRADTSEGGPDGLARGAGALLGRLAPVGQLSLTCYLSSSLLLNFVFYGFGLALYGRTGPAQDVLVGFVVYPVLVLFATVYVRFFRYGPAEWLWRSLTYGRRQPLRLPAAT